MFYYLKTVWTRIRALLTPLSKFLKNVISGAKSLAKTVGKAAVKQVTSAAQLHPETDRPGGSSTLKTW